MAFLSKAELESEAERFGIDLDEIPTFGQKQKVVLAAISEEKKQQEAQQKKEQEEYEKDPIVTIKDPNIRIKDDLEKYAQETVGGDINTDVEQPKAKRGRPRKVDVAAKKPAEPSPMIKIHADEVNEIQPSIEDYRNVTLVASPYQLPAQYIEGKFTEELGNNVITEDISYGLGEDIFTGQGDEVKTASYKQTQTDVPVIASTTMPKFSNRILWSPTNMLLPIADDGKGHRGYYWTHHRLPNVRDLLRQMGIYDEFEHLWRDSNNLFYMNLQLMADVEFTNTTLRRIARELERRDENGEERFGV